MGDEGGRKPQMNIHKLDRNEGKQAVEGWEFAGSGKKRAKGWSTMLPGDTGVVLSAKAERKRAREMELKSMQVDAAAKQPKTEPPRKRAKPPAATATSLADFAAQVVGSDVAGPTNSSSEAERVERRVVSLMQPASVLTAEGKFRKGHMADLKAALEAVGEIEYLVAVADSLELHVVYATVEGAKRALRETESGVGTLRRLSSSEARIFFSAQRAKADASRAQREALAQRAAEKRAGNGKGKGKGESAGRGRGGKGSRGDEGNGAAGKGTKGAKGGGKSGGKAGGKGGGKGKYRDTVSF